MTSITNMTLEELKRLIDQRVEERLSQIFGEFELQETDLLEEPDNRTLQEVFESIEKKPLDTATRRKIIFGTAARRSG